MQREVCCLELGKMKYKKGFAVNSARLGITPNTFCFLFICFVYHVNVFHANFSTCEHCSELYKVTIHKLIILFFYSANSRIADRFAVQDI